MLQFHKSERPTDLRRLEGLNSYLATPATKLETVSNTAYDALSAKDRSAYDNSRRNRLSNGMVFNTPYVAEARLLLQECFAQNEAPNSDSLGLLLNGMPRHGKTTTCTALMKYVYKQYAQNVPDFREIGRAPVVYIKVPPSSTPKALMWTFAEFLGMTVRPGEPTVSITSRVIDVMHAAGVQCVVIDELQNLQARTQGNSDSSSVIKSLKDELPATFILAGMKIDEWVQGPRAQQIGSRSTMVDMRSYNLSKPGDKKSWRALVTDFENALPLRHHQPGTLPKLSEYLWARTGGCIGSLSTLITGSAIEVIDNPAITVEALTEELLDARRLDVVAEAFYAKYQSRKGSRGSAAKALDGRST